MSDMKSVIDRLLGRDPTISVAPDEGLYYDGDKLTVAFSIDSVEAETVDKIATAIDSMNATSITIEGITESGDADTLMIRGLNSMSPEIGEGEDK